MTKFGFISDLDTDKGQKQKFQVFEATLGFEKIRVIVPFQHAEEFATEANLVKPRSAASLKKLVERFGGSVE